jgi:hypothetical protein
LVFVHLGSEIWNVGVDQELGDWIGRPLGVQMGRLRPNDRRWDDISGRSRSLKGLQPDLCFSDSLSCLLLWIPEPRTDLAWRDPENG